MPPSLYRCRVCSLNSTRPWAATQIRVTHEESTEKAPQHENNQTRNLLGKTPMAVPEDPYRRGTGRLRRAHPRRPCQDLCPSCRRARAVSTGERSHPGGAPLAGDVSARVLSRRPHSHQRAKWRRAGPVGSGREVARGASIPVAWGANPQPHQIISRRRHPGGRGTANSGRFHGVQNRGER